ncbi:MAG: hypothetical protein WDA09_02685 [Bacteriovoracaceae bacterium]
MKTLKIVTLSLSCVLSISAFASSSFTNLASINDKLVFAGVKEVEPGMEMVSHLVEIKVDNMKSRKIKLPAEINSREIVGLIPSKKNLIYVVTQMTRGGGDKPQIHSFNTSLNVWRKSGEVDCVSFKEVKLSEKALEFSCEETDEKGNVSMVTKKISADVTLDSVTLTLPISEVKTKEFKASLEGEPFEWDKLKIVSGKKEKIFTP